MIKQRIDEPEQLFRSVVGQESQPREKAYFSAPWLFKPDGQASEWASIPAPSFWNTPEQFDFPQNWKDVRTAWYSCTWEMEGEADE